MRLDIIAALLRHFINENDIIYYEDESPIERYYALRDEILDHCIDIDNDELVDIMDYLSSHPDYINILFR